jgi:NhaP-type Na+/H+ or K+/H+ antiporter
MKGGFCLVSFLQFYYGLVIGWLVGWLLLYIKTNNNVILYCTITSAFIFSENTKEETKGEAYIEGFIRI